MLISRGHAHRMDECACVRTRRSGKSEHGTCVCAERASGVARASERCDVGKVKVGVHRRRWTAADA